ncbi:hypothetical protein VTN00DRAFT_8851 [Thermoascus crustaceus]|uniref:uncharacterized protein n=1 Tax=Thermoascus crustaceus TaxID=5088 RepID=UPI0037448897
MDPSETLPAPILEMVLELIDDLLSLHNLHDAPLAVASLLHEDGVAPVIVEAIISRNVPWHTRHLIRRIALIRWDNDEPSRERTWGQSEYDLNWSGSPGFHFVLNLGGIPQSPLRYVELRVFRRFGFAIWDWRRMEALGFLKTPSNTREEEKSHPNAPVSESDAYFRWRSILTEAELEEVKRRRKHYWPSYDTIVQIPDLFG